MATRCVFVVGVLIVLIAVPVVEATLKSFVAEQYTVKHGGRITLTCTFTATFRDSQHLNKHIQDETFRFDPENEAQLGPRFNITLSESSGSLITYILVITDAQSGDSGNYSCSIYDSSTKLTSHLFAEINVENEPNTTKIYLDGREIGANGSVEMVPLRPYNIQCQSTGSNPGANMTISYATGVKLNVTNVTVSSAIYRFDQRDAHLRFVVPIERNTTAEAKNWTFDLDAFQTRVICLAKVNKDAPGVAASFTPTMRDGAPQLACNDSVYAQDGQKDFVITCPVYSKPELTTASFSFEIGKTSYSITGFPFGEEHYSQDRSYHGIVRKIDQIKYSMSLTIPTVDVKSKIYFKFEAHNRIASSLHAVTITDKKPSGASPVASTCLTVFLCILATASSIQQMM